MAKRSTNKKTSKKRKITNIFSNLFNVKFRILFTLLFSLFILFNFFSEDIALSYKANGITGIYERLRNFDINQIEDYEEFDPSDLDNNYVLFNVFESYGVASYYHDKFIGRKTANGERFSQDNFTAAHKKLKFGSIVKVTNQENHKSILVRINDRGPFSRNRIIDLSKRASNFIDAHGTSSVKIEGIKRYNKYISHKTEDYYNGYSLYSDFVCMPSSEVKLIDSTLNFKEIVDIYLELTEQKLISHLYIFNKALKSETEEIPQDYFYIGYVTKSKQKNKK